MTARRKLSHICTREDRVAYIERLLAEGKWEARLDLVLGRAWDLSPSNVRFLAAEARRALRRDQTPEAQQDLVDELAARLDRVYRSAMRDGDWKGATAAIRERARIAGLDKRTVTHEVTADDFFPKEDK
jgi:hypothetical protein